MAVHYYVRHGSGRHSGATIGMTGMGQGSKRTVEWLEGYNSRPEAQRTFVLVTLPKQVLIFEKVFFKR